jgi:phenylalanyl-tRNA synthetase alpha chain
LIDVKVLTYYIISKGEQFKETFLELKADLTYEDVRNNSYKDLSLFKEMNLSAKGKPIQAGGLHPLMKMRTEFRNILLEMGFEEMDTKQYVESSFFNFDALFQP